MDQVQPVVQPETIPTASASGQAPATSSGPPPAPSAGVGVTPASAPAMEPSFRVKASKPPEFTGKNKRLPTTFLAAHLTLSFAADPGSFRSDRQKIVFAASYLREQAFAWYEPHSLNESPVNFNWETFKVEFLRALGDPDLQRTLESELYALHETSSAADYSTEFFRISSQLKDGPGVTPRSSDSRAELRKTPTPSEHAPSSENF